MAGEKPKSTSEREDDFARRAHGLSHDLRNPIGSVLGYVDLLRDTAGAVLDEEQHSFLSRIEENCKEMLRELARFTAASEGTADES